jgi:transglutaminase-like putative cysteine protease
MRLRIAHSTSYRYEPPASGVIQILRMTPGSHDGQYVAEWQIDVSTDSRLDVHEDAFGNVTHVLTFGAIADHRSQSGDGEFRPRASQRSQ